jgi:hypothetical protein
MMPLWVRDTVYLQIFPNLLDGDPSNDVQDGEYSRMGHNSQTQMGELPHTWKTAAWIFGSDCKVSPKNSII